MMIFVVLALFASACGGSDDSAAEQAETEQNDTEGADDGAPVATPPPPVEYQPIATRDCAHTTVDLTAEADDEEAADAVEEEEEAADAVEEEVELPPAVKPEVGEELLGSFDELKTTDLIVGTGAEATSGATIGMQYVGVLASDGTEFDSSWDRGAQPFVFDLGRGTVIAGWDEGIEGMRVGGRRILQIPAAQAYGDQDRSEVIVANSDLIFIVDLVDVSAGADPAPPIPADSLGAFDTLESQDLVVGDGCTAEIGDIVKVHYVGVDAVDGVEFDSSWGRGETFSLVVGRAQVIEGWNEGITGMNVGGERILQIPAAQAYDDGDLVFRVHLEELIEAPLAHSITFEGEAATQVESTTLVEGTGDGAQPGDIIDANIAIVVHSSNLLIQSTWAEGQTAQLALREGSLIPGLEDSLIGIKEGELRQISLPPEAAYPNGAPQGADLAEDDALVFIVEAVRITVG